MLTAYGLDLFTGVGEGAEPSSEVAAAIGTDAGDTYTEARARAWMDEAGLSRITRKETAFGKSLIVGKKKTRKSWASMGQP